MENNKRGRKKLVLSNEYLEEKLNLLYNKFGNESFGETNKSLMRLLKLSSVNEVTKVIKRLIEVGFLEQLEESKRSKGHRGFSSNIYRIKDKYKSRCFYEEKEIDQKLNTKSSDMDEVLKNLSDMVFNIMERNKALLEENMKLKDKAECLQREVNILSTSNENFRTEILNLTNKIYEERNIEYRH